MKEMENFRATNLHITDLTPTESRTFGPRGFNTDVCTRDCDRILQLTTTRILRFVKSGIDALIMVM